VNIKPDLIIATSIYAVKTAGTYISKHHKTWLNKIPAIGIGPATAGALHAQGWHSVSYPKVYNSEGILGMRAATRLRGKTVVILTGAHGRNLLTQELTTRGACIIQVDGY
jgi:uroporphyrinogen-III synthase